MKKNVKITEETHKILTLIQLITKENFHEIIERWAKAEYRQREEEIKKVISVSE